MRLHRSGRVQRSRAVDVDRDLAAQVDAGQIVVLGFRHAQAVADEHHCRLHRRRQVGAAALRRVQPIQDFFPALADNRDAGFLFHQLTRLELHRLQIARRPRGLESEGLHLSGDIFDRLAVAVAARFAALQFVVRQKLDVRPPAVALRREIGREEGRGAQSPELPESFMYRIILNRITTRQSQHGHRMAQEMVN